MASQPAKIYFPGSTGKIFARMDYFASLRFHFEEGDCRIRVMRNDKGDEREEERRISCEQTADDRRAGRRQGRELEAEEPLADHARRRTRTQYTYIALWFDRLYFKRLSVEHEVVWMATRCPHHISLCYLPWMSDSLVDALLSSLQRVLSDWWDLLKFGDPLERPLAILSSRRFSIGTHDIHQSNDLGPNADFMWSDRDTYAFGDSDFMHESMEDLRVLLDEGRIRLKRDPASLVRLIAEHGSGPESKAEMARLCINFHRRDHGRLASATALERRCVPKYDFGAEVQLVDGRVHAESEVSTLLHYRHEALIDKHGVLYLEPRDEVGVLDDRSWHVTPQTEGLHARRHGLVETEYADCVACVRAEVIPRACGKACRTAQQV